MWQHTSAKRAKKKSAKSISNRKTRKSSKPALPAIGILRNRADKLYQQVFKLKYPKSILSGQPTEVIHHMIKKSESSRLRYDGDNAIPLTTAEHCALHCHETIYSGRIIQIKGLPWFQTLLSRKVELVKTDRQFYLDAIKKLEDILYGQVN